jgi:hypothetical protein
LDPKAKEILDRATDLQYKYVIARMTHPDAAKAARAIGLASRSPFNWDNLDELEEAVKLLRPDVIEVAKLALIELALDAVGALGGALGDKAHRVRAAQAILDRVGLPAASSVDVTSGGEQIKATIYIPENGRD